jgi:hypothetical protein
MTAITKALRFVVGACLGLVLLYCGAGMVLGILTNRILPAFPFSWVKWLDRPDFPPLLDHVINFILTSMVVTLFQSTGRQRSLASKAHNSNAA